MRCSRHRPDVVLLELRLPRRDGIATLRARREGGDTTPVLVLTTCDDDELVRQALDSGANGSLLKDVTFERLVDAAHTLARGGTLIEPGVTDRLLHAAASQPQPDFLDGLLRTVDLTERELEVLRLVAAGGVNREIARRLHLAPGDGEEPRVQHAAEARCPGPHPCRAARTRPRSARDR